MTEVKALKVRLTLCFILVGVCLLMAAVVTDYWAVLSPRVEQYNATCEIAHFGLWRLCTKRIYMSNTNDKSCGPINLPGEYSISAAAISIFSIGFTIMGTIFILLSFRKKRDYLLKPAALFYAFSGLCIIVSVEVMRQSVKRMIDSEETVWIEYYYSWSFACACTSFILLFICGIALLLISLPRMPQNPWESCMDAEPEH
ncbi:voltage-dependent calcium channel gamma-1 subunit isoform 2-T3 [Sarcophilus harrisii]